ncbi:DUF599 domain-containing protein [Shumkonia mesophila]|uniref:DUF599 domain-containing protein n=1 Tax=Shumkonia mesophila TaxID=2838854 RepID=UPI002934B4E9|nr:DUF599 domain-containing protein [Shumkonia mesophila]
MFRTYLGDLSAFACFLVCWVGYTWFADYARRDSRSIMVAMHDLHLLWMRRMLRREVRIGDVNILGVANRSVMLLVTTTVFILAGLVAIMGALDKARELVSGLAFTVQASREMWEIKMLMMILIFTYAFFKFMWSLRQFNYSLQLLGAAPLHDEPDSPDWETFPKRASRVITLAVDSFNRGVRAYYFGLAALGWFIQPWVFGVVSVWIVLVLYRREFRSHTLKTLTAEEGDPFAGKETPEREGVPR